MRHIFDAAFKYTQAKDTDADYLRRKFRQIFDEQEKAKEVTAKVVKPLIKARIPSGR